MIACTYSNNPCQPILLYWTDIALLKRWLTQQANAKQ
ncbi:Uncharacterised protein [Vibrio cholerae]|nr:Uncharacterised protein [Vibrio cholerae]